MSSVSEKRSVFATLRFWTATVRSVGWPATIVVGRKVFVTLIGVEEVRLPENALLGRPRVLPIAFGGTAFTYAVPETGGAATFTVIVQTPDRPIVPPVSVRVVSPGFGANVPFAKPVPEHEIVGVAGFATTTFAGSGSVNVVRGIVEPAFEFVSVIVSVDVPPGYTVAGEKDFAPDGWVSAVTASVMLAGVVLKIGTPFSCAVYPAVAGSGVVLAGIVAV
jgi:hypothetical protein